MINKYQIRHLVHLYFVSTTFLGFFEASAEIQE